jgi:hypothetical protein
MQLPVRFGWEAVEMRAAVVVALMTMVLFVIPPSAAGAGSQRVGATASISTAATDTSAASLTDLRVWPEPWVGRHDLTIAFKIARPGFGSWMRSTGRTPRRRSSVLARRCRDGPRLPVEPSTTGWRSATTRGAA